MARKRYSTDLTDAEWAIIEPLLPKWWTGHRREHDLREIVDAILYLLRSGCSWRLLPHDLPPWPTVQYYFRNWRDNGTWERICQELRRKERVRQGRDPEPTAGIVDSQSVKTTEQGGPRGYDAGKHVNGRKRHLLVDTLGLILKVVVHPANIQDWDGARELLEAGRALFERLRHLWADSGYRAVTRWIEQELGWTVEIVTKLAGTEGFAVQHRRWVVGRTFAWLGKFRRLSKDYEWQEDTSEAWIYVAMAHILVRRLAHA